MINDTNKSIANFRETIFKLKTHEWQVESVIYAKVLKYCLLVWENFLVEEECCSEVKFNKREANKWMMLYTLLPLLGTGNYSF
jgi:hypothetical protein